MWSSIKPFAPFGTLDHRLNVDWRVRKKLCRNVDTAVFRIKNRKRVVVVVMVAKDRPPIPIFWNTFGTVGTVEIVPASRELKVLQDIDPVKRLDNRPVVVANEKYYLAVQLLNPLKKYSGRSCDREITSSLGLTVSFQLLTRV